MKDRAAPSEPLVVEPISFARPASEHQERQLIVHEPASTEAPEAEEVLPQIERQTVSSPVLTNIEFISIGRPLTPISQDASWADRPQPATPSQDSPSTPPPQVTNPVLDDDDDYVVHPTPTPKASPALRRLRKGPRP